MTFTWSRNISDLFAGNIPTVHEGKIKNMKSKIEKWRKWERMIFSRKKATYGDYSRKNSNSNRYQINSGFKNSWTGYAFISI